MPLPQLLQSNVLGSFIEGQELGQKQYRANRLRELAPKALTGDQDAIGELAAVDPESALSYYKFNQARQDQEQARQDKAAKTKQGLIASTVYGLDQIQRLPPEQRGAAWRGFSQTLKGQITQFGGDPSAIPDDYDENYVLTERYKFAGQAGPDFLKDDRDHQAKQQQAEWERRKPGSGIGKIQDDLANGRITPEQAKAAIYKETYVATPGAAAGATLQAQFATRAQILEKLGIPKESPQGKLYLATGTMLKPGEGAPSGYRFTEGGDLAYIPGGPGDPSKPKPQNLKPLPTSMGKAIGEGITQIAQIDRAAKLLNETPDAVGFWKGLQPDAALKYTDPTGVPVRAIVSDIGSLKIHDRSGAAVTAAETPRLRPFIPQVSDPPNVIRDKLSQFRLVYLDILRENLAASGAEAGYQQPLEFQAAYDQAVSADPFANLPSAKVLAAPPSKTLPAGKGTVTGVPQGQPPAPPPRQGGQSGASIPPGAAQALRQHPDKAAEFDAKYGAGAAQAVLGGQ